MEVLCVDKTGTLTTENRARQHSRLRRDRLLKSCVVWYSERFYQTGYANPLDKALIHKKGDLSKWKKLDEIPYDFVRKRLSILTSHEKGSFLITKGAFEQISQFALMLSLQQENR